MSTKQTKRTTQAKAQVQSFVTCSVCDTERLSNTLDEHGRCLFCRDKEPPAPPQEPEVILVKNRRKSTKTRVKPIHPDPSEPSQEAQSTASQAQSRPELSNGLLHPSDRLPEAIRDEVLDIPYAPPSFDINVAAKNPTQELAYRELARRRLLPFIKRFRPKYMAGWVHEDICRRLEQFVKDVADKKSPRLLLMCPPRSGKSEIGSRHLAPWILGQYPDWEIIAASHTASLTLSFSRYIRDLLRDPAYNAVFPDARLDPQSQSVENWNLLSGGGYLAAGVGTGITGRGAHILLLDDLVKDIEAADSATITDNTWEWYGSTAYTRLAPGGGVLGIMTWWSEADWAGRIQSTMETGEGDVFEIVKYPAINEEGDEYILEKLPGRPIRQYGPHDDPPPEGARLTRPMGTALHPARYDTEAMLRIKRNLIATGQKRVWQALYQQNPVPDDGLFFTKEMFRYYPVAPRAEHCNIYQAWDFAITEEQTSDYTVGCTIYQDERDNLYVVDVRRFRSSDSIHIIDTILDYAQEYKATLIGFEDGQIWKTMEAQFTKACEERRFYPSHEVLKPLTDKAVRAHPLRGRMQLGKVFFDKSAPWFTELYKELTRFLSGGKHDDQCLVAGTLISMAAGSEKPIEQIKVGDLVDTPLGPRRVLAAGLTNASAEVYEVSGLTGTKGHPVLTQRGWIPLHSLTDSDTLYVRASQEGEKSSCHAYTKKQQRTLTKSYSKVSRIVDTLIRNAHTCADIIRARVVKVFCTVINGSSIVAQSQKASKSIIKTEIPSTIDWQTSNVFIQKRTRKNTKSNVLLTVDQPSSGNTSKTFAVKLLSGISQMLVKHGIVSMVRKAGKVVSRQSWFVKNVAASLSHSSPTHNSVESLVRTRIGTNEIRVTRLPKKHDALQPVFNLTVEEAHCYYANGILVHNCDALAWCVRLTLSRHAPKPEDRTPKITSKSWKDRLKNLGRGSTTHMAA